MTAALDDALNRLADDPELRAGVLTGGPDIFCAGTDLADGPGGPTPRGCSYGLIARRRTTPLIAAVEGPAYGGGFEIAMACDIIVAGRSARFALPEATHGLVANCGALFRGPRTLPPMVGRHLLLTGQPMPAERLYALGLVSELADDGRAEDAALALADTISANSPAAVSATPKPSVTSTSATTSWAGTPPATPTPRTARAARKPRGLTAFREKREPRW